MRQIKFRGQRLDNGEWVHGHLYVGRTYTGEEYAVIFSRPNNVVSAGVPIQGDPFILAPSEVYPVDPATVGQFTGLLDKNGEGIYEGDVIGFTKKQHIAELNYEVKYFKGGFWLADRGFGGPIEPQLQDIESFAANCGYVTRIMGNIHDNKELIEKE